ncbi:MAG: hypothetical protein R2855_14525 [Thermomicrobiales bacterium]
MNPYLSFSIAMCVVVILALAGTAYLAAYFNRRSKSDMEAALTPLAKVVDGEMEVEDGKVSGRYQGQLAEGKVATMPGGMSRIFVTTIVESAGGEPWEWTLTRSKEPGGPDEARFQQELPGVTDQIEPVLLPLKDDPDLAGIWFRVGYDPASGQLKMTRPMRVRRDIPGAPAFERFLDVLIAAAAANRSAQGPEAASA